MAKQLLINITILLLITVGYSWGTSHSLNRETVSSGAPAMQNIIIQQDTVPLPPSAGTAKVQATITAVDSFSTNFILKIRIQKILGYGAATPPLAPNQKLMINAVSLDESLSLLKPCKKMIMILRHHKQYFGGEEPAAEWTLVESEKINHLNN